MLKNIPISTKVFIATAGLCLVNVGVFVYQVFNLVISPWNIIPTVLVCLIVFGNAKNMLSSKVRKGEAPPSQFGAPPQLGNANVQGASNRENEDFYLINTSFPNKLTFKSIVWKTLFLAIFIGLTCLFAVLGNSVKYDQAVTGTIIEKRVEGEVYTEYDDDGATTTDNRYLVMMVSYEVDGTIYRNELIDKGSTSRKGNFIEVCVTNDGELVCAYDSLLSKKIMMYSCLILAVLTFLGFVFKLPNQYLVMLVFMLLGIGVTCLFNAANWADWLLKDFTLFGGCFFTLGVMCYLQLVLLRIIHTIGKRRDPNFIIT